MMAKEERYEPLPRWGHTSVIIGDKVYMWGGRIEDFSESSKKELASVVEVFHISDEIWEQKKTKGTPPLGLYNTAFTAIGNHLYVYGGWDGHSAHNTLHRLNVDTLTWEEMKSSNDDNLPMKMSGCGLVAKGADKLVLFGGYGLPSASTTPNKNKGKNITLVTKSKTPNKTPVHSQSSVDENGEIWVNMKTDVDVEIDATQSQAASQSDVSMQDQNQYTNGQNIETNMSSQQSTVAPSEITTQDQSQDIATPNWSQVDQSQVTVAPSEANTQDQSQDTNWSTQLIATTQSEANTQDQSQDANWNTSAVPSEANGQNQSQSSEEDKSEVLVNNMITDIYAEINKRNKRATSEEKTPVPFQNGDVESGGEEEDEEDEEEVLALVNKHWTNELKVYDIQNGCWTSPEVSGDCPPPCVDFSFDCIDDRMAVLFGGYRPESGASGGAYILDMETWNWIKLGEYETSKERSHWPVSRDGHTSCVLSEMPYPQILVTGGWDKDNRLINDAWILNLQTKSWKKFAIPETVGARFWHRVVCYKYSAKMCRLVFFGGCPGAPMDIFTGGGSWDKLAATVLVDIGQVREYGDNGHQKSTSRNSFYATSEKEHEWVPFDSIDISLMGKSFHRMKERVFLAEYRATQADTRARKAEKIAKDALHRLETALSRLEKMHQSSPPPSQIHSSDSLMSITKPIATDEKQFWATKPIATEEKPFWATKPVATEEKPFWAISRNEIQLTSEEVGRGRWGIIRVAMYKEKKVAARCLYSQIVSEYNRKVFVKGLDIAANMRHQNILPFIGAVLEGEPVIITELMPSNLKKVIEIGQLQNYQIVSIALDIANALYFLHTTRPNPVVHGDLTSTSVLLEKGGGNLWKAKLSDFMTAKFFQKLVKGHSGDSDHEMSMSPVHERHVFSSRSNTPRLTPPPPSSRFLSRRDSDSSMNKKLTRYDSETSINNRRLSGCKRSPSTSDFLDMSLTLESDIYSLGILLIEMCTGTSPLGVSLQFLIESITWMDMSSLVKSCIEQDSGKRPTAETVVNNLKIIHRATFSRPSKFSKK